MQIKVGANVKNDGEPWLSAILTFVARDPKTGKSVELNRLIPETHKEEEEFLQVGAAIILLMVET